MKTIIKSFIFILLFAFSTPYLTAGPTIIRDNRVTDTGTTPYLGRGYSIATNTYQSVCMKNVSLTDPSYDFRYEFVQAESKGEESSTTQQSTSTSQTTSQRKSWSSSGRSGFFGQNRSSSSLQTGLDELASSVKKTTVVNGRTYNNFSMFAKIDVISYYASLDEGKSRLSDATVLLLQNNDLPGFFSSCGPYYVRSMGREATFISMFTYRLESTTRDESFEEQLKNEIAKFTTYSRSSSSWWGRSSSSYSESNSSKDTKEEENKRSFHSKAENYNLTITTRAYGMGKDQKATLISYDIDSFKAALKDAFLAMQNVSTGKVVSIEVVPWIENTEFQSIVKLEEEEVQKTAAGTQPEGAQAAKPQPTGGTDATPQTNAQEDADQTKTEKKLLYEKKHTLNQNAEFFMEIERADRNKMNMYYKARMCKKNLDAIKNFIGAEAAKAGKLVNHREEAPITITDFEKQVDDTYIDKLYWDEQKFMFGYSNEEEKKAMAEQKAKKGAAECIKQIMSKGIYKTSYREIEPCKDIAKEMGDIELNIIESYCMPQLTD